MRADEVLAFSEKNSLKNFKRTYFKKGFL